MLRRGALFCLPLAALVLVVGSLAPALAEAAPGSAAGAVSSVVTGPATSVTSSSATLSGSWQFSGQGPLMLAFYYGIYPTLLDKVVPVGSETAASGTVPPTRAAGLASNTTYYYRLVGIKGSQRITGAVESFSTAPSPTTGPPSTTTAPTTTAPPSTTTSPPAHQPQAPAPSQAPLPPPSAPARPVPATGTPDGNGYWVAGADGSVYSFGDAQFYGAPSALHPTSPVVCITATPDGAGYWVAAADGTVYSFGDAQFYGAPSALHPTSPVVQLTSTPDGKGYWVLTADGGVYSFGDARFPGSANGVRLPTAAVALTATPDGQGYWLALANGAVLNFGDAPLLGSAGLLATGDRVTSMSATPDGQGYWLATAQGDVYTFGDASFFGDAQIGALAGAVVALTPTADGGGYWLVTNDGRVLAFGDAHSYGAPSTLHAPQPMVGMATTWIHPLADVPQEYLMLSQAAARTCPALPWEVLAAIAKVESDFGRSTLPGVASGTNSAGAAGPMQMGIGGAAGRTFYAYDHPIGADRSATPVPPGVDPPNPWDPTDAVYAAARDLCANGGGRPDSLHSAIFAYNHAEWYVSEVEALAATFAGGTAYGSAAGPAASAAIELAISQIGTPYTWGGASPQAGFDCSGLVQWSFAQAGIQLPRTSEQQWAALPHLVPGAPLLPGDLVFFEPGPSGPGHVGIYLGDGLMVDAPHSGATVRVEPYNWSSYVGAAIP